MLVRHVLLFLVLSSCFSVAEELRVVSWNLQWFPGRKPGAPPPAQNEHLNLVSKELSKLKPDILLMQEVRDWASLESLMKPHPGLTPVVISKLPGSQQLGIASTLKANSAWFERWKTDGVDDPPRGFAFAALELPNGKLLAVYNVHLKSNWGDPVSNRVKREEAMKQLIEHAKRTKAAFGEDRIAGIIIGGDFNTTLDPDPRFDEETTLRSLVEAGFHWTGKDVPLAKRISLPATSHYPAVAFDHLFLNEISPAKCKTVGAGEASDHRPVIISVPLRF